MKSESSVFPLDERPCTMSLAEILRRYPTLERLLSVLFGLRCQVSENTLLSVLSNRGTIGRCISRLCDVLKDTRALAGSGSLGAPCESNVIGDRRNR